MSTPDPADYAWIADAEQVAACLTFVAGATVPDVLTAFGADASVTATLDDVHDAGGQTSFVGAVAVDGGVMAYEDNGFQGAQPEVLERVSHLGRTASIFWNVNDDNMFSCAADGAVVAAVDMYDADIADELDLPEDLRPLFALAEIDDEDEDSEGPDLWAIGAAMAQRFTGVRVTEADVRAVTVFHPVAP